MVTKRVKISSRRQERVFGGHLQNDCHFTRESEKEQIKQSVQWQWVWHVKHKIKSSPTQNLIFLKKKDRHCLQVLIILSGSYWHRGLFLYPLKTPKIQRFFDNFRKSGRDQWHEIFYCANFLTVREIFKKASNKKMLKKTKR